MTLRVSSSLNRAARFLKEVFWGLKDYIKNYPAKADKVKLSSIEKGHASIVEIENDKYGVYRDEQDTLHLVGAKCTHMKCIVKWNQDEKSWDCPCHGSRFTHEGKVLNGPANDDLFYLKEEGEQSQEAVNQQVLQDTFRKKI